jgi:microcystin-dependent protein
VPWNGVAPSQTFGRTDGTRTGSTVWQTADAAGVDIVSDDHDTHDQDVADGISSCIKKDGGNAATSNLPMGGFRHTNVGAASARTNYARFSDLQDGKGIYVPTVGGTANAITLTTGYSLDAYAAGQKFSFIAASANSDATTIAVDGLAAKDVRVITTALTSGQIAASALITVQYDGTYFQLVSYTATPAAIAVGFVAAWPLSTVPTGWLECDGSAVSRSTYAALFAVYGTSYGSGDGSTTFNLPNYKDYFLRGFDSAGTDAASRTDRGDGTTGASVGTKQTGDYLAHTHTFSATTSSDGAHTHTVPLSSNDAGGTSAGDATGTTGTATTSSNGAHTHTVSGTSGTAPASGGTETRPKNITVKWCCLALPAAALAIGTGFTRSPRLCHTGGIPAQVNTDGTDTTPSVTETYICEVFVPGPGSVTLTGISLFNGSAVAGNIKLALADSAGNIVAQTASTAQSGTDAYQRVPFSATYAAVGPATYYVLLQNNNTGNRFNSHTFGDFGASKKTGETFGTFTTITAPSTFTTALGPMASLY